MPIASDVELDPKLPAEARELADSLEAAPLPAAPAAQLWDDVAGPLMPDDERARALAKGRYTTPDRVGFGPPGAVRSLDLDDWEPHAVWLKRLDERELDDGRYDNSNERRTELRELPRTLILGALGEPPKTPLLWRFDRTLVLYGPRNERLNALAMVHPLHTPALSLAALERAARTLNPWQTGTERWEEIAQAVQADCGLDLRPWLKESRAAVPVLVKRDLPAPAPGRWTREPELVERTRSWLTELAERDVVSASGAHALILAALPRGELRVQRPQLPERLDFIVHLGGGAVVEGTLWRFTGEPSAAIHHEPPTGHSSAVDLDGSDLRLRYSHSNVELLTGVAT